MFRERSIGLTCLFLFLASLLLCPAAALAASDSDGDGLFEPEDDCPDIGYDDIRFWQTIGEDGCPACGWGAGAAAMMTLVGLSSIRRR